MLTKSRPFGIADVFAVLLVCLCSLSAGHSAADAQEDRAQQDGERPDGSPSRKIGYVIDVQSPLETSAAANLLNQLTRLNESTPEGSRVTVVLRYASPEVAEADLSASSQFEDALKLARAMTGSQLRRVRVVALVEGELTGHLALPVIASDMLLVNSLAMIADASAGDADADETVELTYRSIAQRRGVFPAAVVSALVDPGLELARVSKVGGDQVFASGEQLDELRKSGQVLGEDVWSEAGEPLRLDSRQLRGARIAAGVVDSLDQAAELLDLAELNPIDERVTSGEVKGVLLDITGSIAPGRVRRWQSNLSSTLTGNEVNTWVVSIDSNGGSLGDSATLAGWFANPDPPLETVAGLIRGEARGDAALIAVACKPLYMDPDARIGGQGADAISSERVEANDQTIEAIALATRRPSALIRGLLDPQLAVFRYTHRKTGRLRYATREDISADAESAEDPEAEIAKWVQGDRVDLSEGLNAAEAVSLGLADGQSPSLEDTARRIGMSGIPEPISDRKLIRFVEGLGRSQLLAFFLIFVGFSALSAEANAPGLGVPGFFALVCFALWFWIQFLAGTAEWLELIVFALGLICIAMEIFVVPGFGVFGIGGLALTAIGLVLMSQTFVIPRNSYQLQVLTKGVWVALGGAGGMVAGMVAMRALLPRVPIFRGLIMEEPDEAGIAESEKLGDYSALLGVSGITTTPLRPSGKARFGEEIVQVVSDGTAIGEGERIRVAEVHATKVVVEPIESE